MATASSAKATPPSSVMSQVSMSRGEGTLIGLPCSSRSGPGTLNSPHQHGNLARQVMHHARQREAPPCTRIASAQCC